MANRFVCCLAISLLMGILWGTYGNALLLAGFFLFLLSVSITIFTSQKNIWKIVFIRNLFCILFFCLGFCQLHNQLEIRNQLEEVLEEGKQITVKGKVQKKEETATQYRYILTDTHVLADGMIYPCHGILVYSSNKHIQPGNILKITGAYAPFQISRNEGNFNEKKYYQSKKIEFRLYAQKETLILEKKGFYSVFLEKVRRKFRNVYLQCMSQKDAGLLADMTLGDKTLLDKEIKNLYQAAGIAHILAISGLHISLLGMGSYRLLQRFFCPKRICGLISIGMVFSFGLLSGMEISTVRAILMFSMGITARILGCSYDSSTALGLSFMVQIWKNPFLLDHTGFLFSYSAVLGVTVIAAILKKSWKDTNENEKKKEKCLFWRKWLKKCWETMFVSGCIQLATLPLSLYFYYEIPCYGILINGCMLPLMGPLLFLSVLGAFSGSIFLPAGKFILTPAGWLLAANEWICQKALCLPGAVWIAGKPEIVLIFLYYGVLIVILYLLWKGAGKKWLTGIFLALGMLLFLRESPRFEIDVLDVGQGDGILIQTEEGEHFFVDGGSSDVKQVGIYRILPFLKSKGIASIKGWILSHADQDHISGFLELLEAGYPIEYVIVGEGMVRDEASEKLLYLVKKAGCRVIFAKPGMKFGMRKGDLQGKDDLIFTVFHPKSQEMTEEKNLERNGNSLVISLEYHGFTGIFTGDIGEKEEAQMVKEREIETWMRSNKIKKIDFYKGAHHGSNRSNSQQFLEMLSPKLAVISCGKGNSYGHPGAEAMERLRDTANHVLCTMDHGEISVQFSKIHCMIR